MISKETSNLQMDFALNYLNSRTRCQCKHPILVEYSRYYRIWDCIQCLGYVTEQEIHEGRLF